MNIAVMYGLKQFLKLVMHHTNKKWLMVLVLRKVILFFIDIDNKIMTQNTSPIRFIFFLFDLFLSF